MGSKQATTHPDGELYKVTYQCGIEYAMERIANGGANGTFSNKVTGVAHIRIHDAFPRKRPMHIISWGQPQLNWDPGEDEEDGNAGGVDPAKWMPIGNAIGKRPDDPSMAACRTATQELTKKLTKARRNVEVPEIQKLLLGPHASLPRLAQVERAAHSSPPATGPAEGVASQQQKVKPKRRQH